jgi:hypothetical protein
MLKLLDHWRMFAVSYVIVPVRMAFQFKWTGVQIPAVGFVARVETEFEIHLQEISRGVCNSDEGIHVR